MRHLGAVLGAGVLFALVAGCAQHSTVAAGGGSLNTANSPTSTVITGTVVPGPAMPGIHLPAGAVPVAGTQVDAHSLPASFPREVWMEHNGTVLGFNGEDGGCATSSAVLTQTAKQVTIRLIQQEPGTGAHVCPMYLRYKPMAVTLAEPLGTRMVVLQLSIVRG